MCKGSDALYIRIKKQIEKLWVKIVLLIKSIAVPSPLDYGAQTFMEYDL